MVGFLADKSCGGHLAAAHAVNSIVGKNHHKLFTTGVVKQTNLAPGEDGGASKNESFTSSISCPRLIFTVKIGLPQTAIVPSAA
jgi:hypothetical protein